MTYALDLDLGTSFDPVLDYALEQSEHSAVVLETETTFLRVEPPGDHDLIALDRLEALYALRELASFTALA